MKNTLFTILLIAIYLFSSSCSSGDGPSNTQARDDLQQIFMDISDEMIQVNYIEKTNALTKVIDENSYYIFELSAEIAYTGGGWFDVKNIGSATFDRLMKKYSEVDFETDNIFDGRELDEVGERYTYLEPGAIANINGKIFYEETEKGWRPVKHEFTNFELIKNEVDLSKSWNQSYYDQNLGFWQADKRDAYITQIEIKKENGKYIAIFTKPSIRPPTQIQPLYIKNRKLTFNELDRPTYITYWRKRDKLILGFNGTYSRSQGSIAPAEKANPANPHDFLKGTWTGKHGEKSLTLHINKITNGKASGYNQVDETSRNVNGEIIEKSSTSYEVILREPGDHKWDGVFTLFFQKNDGMWQGSGSWKANNGKLSRNVTLSK